MPIPDPRAGRAFVWLVSCFLFISIAAGGSFLAMYMLLPESRTWFAVAGVILVCLPWVFWIFTCLYRIVSRSCGFRMIIGGGDMAGAAGGGKGGSGGGSGSNHGNNNNNNNGSVSKKDMNFDEPVSTQDGGGSERGRSNNETKNRKGSSSSSGHSSITSHESERPLALSIAS